MAVGEWLDLRTGTLLVLASIIAALAFLFGNEYVTHGPDEEGAEHTEEAGAGAEMEEEAEQEGEEETGSRSTKIVGSILLSTAGAGLVPLGLVLAQTRRRCGYERVQFTAEEPPVADQQKARDATLERVLRPALALLPMGAAVIHFV